MLFAGPGPSMLLLCSGLRWDSHHLGLTPEPSEHVIDPDAPMCFGTFKMHCMELNRVQALDSRQPLSLTICHLNNLSTWAPHPCTCTQPMPAVASSSHAGAPATKA